MGRVSAVLQAYRIVDCAFCHLIAIDSIATFRTLLSERRPVIFAHELRDVLLEDAPGDVALVDIFADDFISVLCRLFVRLLKCALISVEAIEIDEFLLDQVAFTLIVTVAATRNDWNLSFFKVGQHLFMISEDLNCVGQYLR